jgi:hypothetical protein
MAMRSLISAALSTFVGASTMAVVREVCSLFLACACVGWAGAQDVSLAPALASRPPAASADDNQVVPSRACAG